MSLMHRYEVTDRAGQRHVATLADCLNVQRTPAWRQRILDRTFHQVSSTDGSLQVEKSFFYLDLARGQAFLVHPPRERYRYAVASEQLDRMLKVLTKDMRARAVQLRVAFGTEELREKLVAADAGLDDRAVELMKAAAMHDHPVLLTRPRLRMSLDEVNAKGARFLVQYDHAPKAFAVTYQAPEVFCGETKPLKGWSGTMARHDLYKLPKKGDHWVNYRRWVPSQDAMADLHAVVLALGKGQAPAVESAAFQSMLERLPRGSSLSSQGKTDLRKLFDWVKKHGSQKLQDQLFEIRFGVELEDSWYRNRDKNDIDTLWRLLKNLPDSHVEGNSKLEEINLGHGSGGIYSPSTMEIEIGASLLAHKESFEDTLRHEVGHAVHEANQDLVDGWLWSRFGFTMFPVNQPGIDDWITQMGPVSGYAGLNATQKAQVRALVRQAAGPGEQWGPPSPPSAPVGSPWRAQDFGPRLAFERSGDSWYANNANWYRVNGKAFAFNFWYAQLMCVNEATLDFVNHHMPDNYAAMSPAEFFAEIYALYYDIGDPQRKHLPADVMAWIKAKLGGASVSQPAKPKSASSKTTRNRPARPAAKRLAAKPARRR
jgi:CpXC protein